MKNLVRFALLLALCLAGCSEVIVKRVQQNDYKTEGFRYYLPRPYVAVKKEHPVAGGEYIVAGVVRSGSTVIEIDPNSVPQVLIDRQVFTIMEGDDTIKVSTSAVVKRKAPASGNTAQDPTPTADDLPKAGDAPTTAATPNVIQNDDWLKGSAAAADKSKAAILLSKSATFTGEINSPKIALIPFANDKPDPTKAITFDANAETKWEKGKADGGYGAAIKADKINAKTTYGLGLMFNAKVEGDSAAKTHLVHGSKPDPALTSAATAGEDLKKDKVNDGGGDGEQKVDLVVMGNPSTDPLMAINNCFDVVMLPDFDQQYAIRVKPGLGKASAKIGLENGWMMEYAEIDLDNSKLGDFIFENTQKAFDIALSLVAPGAVQMESAAGLIAAEGGASEGLGQGNTGDAANPTDVAVALKVSYVAHATPGLYPILKPSERAGCCTDGNKCIHFVFKPNRPYTVVAFNIKEKVQIELIDATATGKVSARDDDGSGDANAPVLEDATRVNDDKIHLIFNSEISASHQKAITESIRFVYLGNTKPLNPSVAGQKTVIDQLLASIKIHSNNKNILIMDDIKFDGKLLVQVLIGGDDAKVDLPQSPTP